MDGMGHEDTKGLGGRRWDDPGLRDALHRSHVDGASVSHGDILFFGSSVDGVALMPPAPSPE